MRKGSSFHVEDKEVDLREEARVLSERTIDIVSTMLLYSSNLDYFYESVECRLGKRFFKKSFERISNVERNIIINHANDVISKMEDVKRIMHSNKRKE